MMRTEELFEIFKNSTGVSIDTRTIEKGNLFFAIKGPNFDGHAYISAALDAGAAYAIADDSKYIQDERVIYVNNTMESLQSLARYRRALFAKPVIGITGSNGKTTTKELVVSVLKTKYNVYATKGNYNNHLGVPLSILSIADEHEIAIIEMGANHQGEIKFLSEIAMPDIGVITNIGKAHLEGFGGIEGVRKGKTELYKYLDSTYGVIFYNEEDEYLVRSLPKNTSNISYSLGSTRLISNFPYVSFCYKDIEIQSNLTGAYNMINMVAALSLGEYFGLDSNHLKEGIESYIPENNRSQIKKTERNVLIMDAYNANPSSMIASIKNFNAYPSEKKTLIIGHMLELGPTSTQEHKDLVDYIGSFKWDNVFLVGSEFFKIQKEIPFSLFKNTKELRGFIKPMNLSGHAILLKGSRGVALEKSIDLL